MAARWKCGEADWGQGQQRPLLGSPAARRNLELQAATSTLLALSGHQVTKTAKTTRGASTEATDPTRDSSTVATSTMALQLPVKLKIPEIQKFATRASQFEKYRPIVTYWCEYHILQTVLNKQLHTINEECQTYALQLMDKLESYKASNPTNDAIVDDVAAKAYMENFALETFSRADDAQRANKVTKQTADAFMAAATFFSLLEIWGEVDKEFTTKSKFAKFHAARILKAFKAGEDPNATNPVIEEPPAPPEDGLEDELKDLERQESGVGGSSYQAPSVENVEHDVYSPGPRSSSQGQPSAPPKIQTPTQYETFPAPPGEHEVSPIDPPPPPNQFIDPPPDEVDDTARQNSTGGGYFPPLSDGPPPAATPSDMNPQDFYNTNAPPPPAVPSAPSPSSLGLGSDNRPSRPTPDHAMAPGPTSPYTQPAPPAAPIIPQAAPMQPVYHPQQPAPTQHAPPPPPPVTGYRTDDEATMLAQKHARWAISALNFEDVNTAVQELRLALQSLGAT